MLEGSREMTMVRRVADIGHIKGKPLFKQALLIPLNLTPDKDHVGNVLDQYSGPQA